MGLLGLFGESFNPGPTGDVKIGGSERPPRSNGEASVRFAVAVVMLLGALVGVFALAWPVTLATAAIILGVAAVYLVLGYFVRPRANMDNLGWAGGLFDNPFRWSDDFNRSLLFFQVFLFPGRFIAESIVDFFRG